MTLRDQEFLFFSIVGSGVRTRWLVFSFYFHIHLVEWRMGLSFNIPPPSYTVV